MIVAAGTMKRNCLLSHSVTVDEARWAGSYVLFCSSDSSSLTPSHEVYMKFVNFQSGGISSISTRIPSHGKQGFHRFVWDPIGSNFSNLLHLDISWWISSLDLDLETQVQISEITNWGVRTVRRTMVTELRWSDHFRLCAPERRLSHANHYLFECITIYLFLLFYSVHPLSHRCWSEK